MTEIAVYRDNMQTEEWYESLDKGIRFPVKVLHANGLETGQSCEGGKGHAYDRATIDLPCSPVNTGEGFKALAALTQVDLPVFSLAYHYDLRQGLPTSGFWRIEFSRPVHHMVNDWPMFVYGYYCDPRGC